MMSSHYYRAHSPDFVGKYRGYVIPVTWRVHLARHSRAVILTASHPVQTCANLVSGKYTPGGNRRSYTQATTYLVMHDARLFFLHKFSRKDPVGERSVAAHIPKPFRAPFEVMTRCTLRISVQMSFGFPSCAPGKLKCLIKCSSCGQRRRSSCPSTRICLTPVTSINQLSSAASVLPVKNHSHEDLERTSTVVVPLAVPFTVKQKRPSYLLESATLQHCVDSNEKKIEVHGNSGWYEHPPKTTRIFSISST